MVSTVKITKVFGIGLATLWLALTVSCGKSNLSDRDIKRSQLSNAAEVKRKELAQVVGQYQGVMKQDNGPERVVVLTLEIKDIPTTVEGSVDPVLHPVLTGYLKFVLGSDPNEYVGFAVQKADFNAKTNKLDMVSAHNDFKEILFSLMRVEGQLEGRWTAPSVSTSGTAKFQRGPNPPAGSETDVVRGEYGGLFYREGAGYQFGILTLQTTFQPPEGLKVTATLRLIFGEVKSTEYLTYRFEPFVFNPLSGQMVLKGNGLEVALSGSWSQGVLHGDWSSIYTGRLGKFKLMKNSAPVADPASVVINALSGSYQGSIKNTNPASNLPERAVITFVTSQDPTQPNGVRVTGNLRLYVGPFGSLEYYEQPFTEVHHNFFTNQVVAKTSGEYRLTVKASVSGAVVKGVLFADGLGQVADIEVAKP